MHASARCTRLANERRRSFAAVFGRASAALSRGAHRSLPGRAFPPLRRGAPWRAAACRVVAAARVESIGAVNVLCGAFESTSPDETAELAERPVVRAVATMLRTRDRPTD
jgi:hypothetical protein